MSNETLIGVSEAEIREMHRAASEIMERWRKSQTRKYKRDRESVNTVCNTDVHKLRSLLVYWAGQPWKTGVWDLGAIRDDVYDVARSGEDKIAVPASLLFYLTAPLVERWDEDDRKEKLDVSEVFVESVAMMPMTAKSYFYEGVLLKVILGRDPKIMFTGEVKHGRPGEIQIDLHRVSFDLASLLEKKVVRANEGPEEFVVKTHDDLVVMHGKGNVVAIRLDDVHETLKSVRATVKLAYY